MPAGERDGAPASPARRDEEEEQEPDYGRRVVDEDVPILRVRDAAGAAFLAFDHESRLARKGGLEGGEVGDERPVDDEQDEEEPSEKGGATIFPRRFE